MTKKRETSKTVKIQGRTFEITKMDAMTGAYILYQLMDKALPMLDVMLPAFSGGVVSAEALTKVLSNGLPKMRRDEFEELARDCLSVVTEVNAAGNIPVFNTNGSYRINGLERNTALLIGLIIHALVFNVSDFFAESGLRGLMPEEPLPDSSQ